jgi:FkbM family methyltransferase
LLARPILCVDPPFWGKNHAQAVKLVRQAQNVISFENVRFYIPLFPTDFLPRYQVMSGTFFEKGILDYLAYCVPAGGIVFDIGANVGNHAVYWAIKRSAYKVYAFEPVLSTFSLLETNIALNLAEKTNIPLNYAISDHLGQVSIGKVDLQNIGATRMKKDDKGAIVAITLDSFHFLEQRVDFVKIDVEGFECNVIRGGIHFLEKYHPAFIFIEIYPIAHRNWIRETLSNLGYQFLQQFGRENFLWRFNGSTTLSEGLIFPN